MKRSWLSLLVIALACAACRPRSDTPAIVESASSSAAPIFQDVTAASGIAFTYRNGEEAAHYAILETLGGGVGLIDYDGDGLIDVFLPGGGSFEGKDRREIRGAVNRLYRNRGNWKFEDVTSQVGLDRPLFYSHGVAAADFDCDGWPDLLVTGYDGLALLRNVPDGEGGRKLVDISRRAGLPEHAGWCTSAAWADLNGDGFPDLYVCRYVNWSFQNHPPCTGPDGVGRDVCTPKNFEALPDLLFINVAGPNGRALREVGRAAGLRVPPRDDRDYGKGLGVLITDLDGDGRPDIYVANDTTDNFLYLNEGGGEVPKFRESGLTLGVARDGGGTPSGSMGVDAADYDGCGRPSIWVTNYENELHALYRHVDRAGRRYWQFSSQLAGTSAIGQTYVGFGTAFLDFDGDGWEDLVVANGHVLRRPARGDIAQTPTLFRNKGDGRFEAATPRAGPYFASAHRGRGLAVGDLDNDGRPDLVISHVNEPVTVLRNVGPAPPAWVGLRPCAPNGGDATGARIAFETGGRPLTRFVKAGGSYLSSGDRRLLFALPGRPEVVRVEVAWPGGRTKSRRHELKPADAYQRLERGSEAAPPDRGP